MTPHNLLDGIVAPHLLVGLEHLAITGLCLDSSEAKPGFAFCALQGTKMHGLQFAEHAIANGAAVVLHEPGKPPEPSSARFIEVPDLRKLLGTMAAKFYADAPMPRLIGVTGTNGKTTTVQLLAQMLSALGLRCATIGTLGVGFPGQLTEQERTTPDVIAVHRNINNLSKASAHAVAMEVSSHALEQARVAGLKFEVALFTNLTRDHLDYHQSMAAYFSAKAKLFQVPDLRAAIVNVDDAYGCELLASIPKNVPITRIGTTPAADCYADQLKLDEHGMHFLLHLNGASHAVSTRLVGRFNVLNLLGVIAACSAMGFALPEIIRQIPTLSPVTGRMNVFGGGELPLVVVDYAHTPDALEQALNNLRAHTRGRLICVFGCGGDRDTGKRPIMGEIAGRLADQVWITSDNPRTESAAQIMAAIASGTNATSVRQEADRRLAIQLALQSAMPGDLVLIAGKGHENYQEIQGKKLPFDDAKIVQQWLHQVAA